MPSVWKDYPLGIDVSHWQPDVDWEYLKQYISFAMAKCGEVQEGISPDLWYDKGFAEKVDGAYKAGIPLGAYCVTNPYAVVAQYGNGVSLDVLKTLQPSENPEYLKLREWLANKIYYFIAVDLERWWDNYAQYYQLLNHQITIDKVKVISSQWIMAEFLKLLEHIEYGKKKKELRDVPVVVYTGEWFTDAYCKQDKTNLFYDWAAKAEPTYQIWTAKYMAPSEVTTWEDVRNHLPDGVTQKPAHAGFVNVLFWQFSGGSLVVPNGKYRANGFDINLSLKSKEALYTWMNFTPGLPTPEPNPEPNPAPNPEPEPDPVDLTVVQASLDRIEAILNKHFR
jgi:hypothetical protein